MAWPFDGSSLINKSPGPGQIQQTMEVFGNLDFMIYISWAGRILFVIGIIILIWKISKFARGHLTAHPKQQLSRGKLKNNIRQLIESYIHKIHSHDDHEKIGKAIVKNLNLGFFDKEMPMPKFVLNIKIMRQHVMWTYNLSDLNQMQRNHFGHININERRWVKKRERHKHAAYIACQLYVFQLMARAGVPAKHYENNVPFLKHWATQIMSLLGDEHLTMIREPGDYERESWQLDHNLAKELKLDSKRIHEINHTLAHPGKVLHIDQTKAIIKNELDSLRHIKHLLEQRIITVRKDPMTEPEVKINTEHYLNIEITKLNEVINALNTVVSRFHKINKLHGLTQEEDHERGFVHVAPELHSLAVDSHMKKILTDHIPKKTRHEDQVAADIKRHCKDSTPYLHVIIQKLNEFEHTKARLMDLLYKEEVA
ncbi:hypothetical protein ACFL0V_02125 [Nanoarchaeota archaeon]